MRRITILIMILISSVAATAQNIRNNITVELTGGLSPITYETNMGSRKGMAGTSGALKYQYHFNWNWSIGVGVEVKMYQSATRFDSFADSYTTEAKSLLTGEADKMQFSYNYKNLEERQRALYLNIPIFAQYRFDCGFYLRLGAKLGIPAKGRGEIYFEELKTEGYFPHENILYTNLPQHGFGTYNQKEIDYDYDLNINGSLCAELGWSWDWNEQYMLYLGVHGEYGFGNIYSRTKLKPLLQYNGGDLEHTPLWDADAKNGANRVAITGDRAGTFAVALLIRYSFGF